MGKQNALKDFSKTKKKDIYAEVALTVWCSIRKGCKT
jgi:hypothetical protein